MPAEILYAKVADFQADVGRLVRYYEDVVSREPATQYHDHNTSYEGWALTSRDGTVSDGVRRIDRGSPAGGGESPAARAPSGRGNTPTVLHGGAVAEVLDRLEALGLAHFRARIMRLANEGFDMKWHRDADRESWRLHLPITTNPHSFFEWKLDDGIHRIHMPADGTAWLIRVDKLHRAINNGPPGAVRVHLLMSLARPPAESVMRDPFRLSATGA